MAYQISRREVLDNLIRFKENLLEIRGLNEKNGRSQEEKEQDFQGQRKQKRIYKLLLNRKTGDMRFVKKIRSLEQHIAQRTKKSESIDDWKEVRLVVSEGTARRKIEFSMSDPAENALSPTELDPLAWKVANETLEVLNLKSSELESINEAALPEESVLEDLSSVHVLDESEDISDLPGWVGSLGRIEAEKRLFQKPVGTYLLREGDEITLSASFHFSEENFLSIHPYILTVVEREKKIVDILFLKTNKGWVLYHDDPNLLDNNVYFYYPTAQDLIKSIEAVAKNPVF